MCDFFIIKIEFVFFLLLFFSSHNSDILLYNGIVFCLLVSTQRIPVDKFGGRKVGHLVPLSLLFVFYQTENNE